MIWHDYIFIDFYVLIEIQNDLPILRILNCGTVREAGPYNVAQKLLSVFRADGYEIIARQIIVIAFQPNPFSFHRQPQRKRAGFDLPFL